MKNRDEMVNSLFERREQYITEQKRKRKVIVRTTTSMCCVCLVALLGFGMWQSDIFNGVSPNKVTEDALSGIKDNFDISKGGSFDNPAANNKIIVHQMDGLSDDRAKINVDLLLDDFVEMNKNELNEYYGINVFPTIPEDIEEWEEQNFGIYKRDGGSGEVYWDGTVINYSNEEYSRKVNIEVQKGSLPYCDVAFFDTIEEKSIINNLEVVIAKSDNGYFYAEFMYQNVGFRIIAYGITQDEFVAIVSSLIK